MQLLYIILFLYVNIPNNFRMQQFLLFCHLLTENLNGFLEASVRDLAILVTGFLSNVDVLGGAAILPAEKGVEILVAHPPPHEILKKIFCDKISADLYNHMRR